MQAPGLARVGCVGAPPALARRLSHVRVSPCARVRMSAEPEPLEDAASAKLPVSLEDKMKSWEATDEERRAKTLLGVVPGKFDAFELGLNIAFPLILVTFIGIAFFPFYAASLAGDAGPPPMQ